MSHPIISPNEQIRISHGSQVALHFEVFLDNGMVVDSTFSRPQPVMLTIGDGNLLSGFEAVLMNLTAGDIRTAHLAPEQAFGAWNEQNVQTFSKSQFALANAQNPEVGMMIEFEDKGKNTLSGVVSQVTDDTVEVDFNHPLAGKHINFKVQIFRVTPAGENGITLH